MLHIDFNSNKNKLIAAAVTILVTALTVVILILVKHFPPDPPIAERGVEVALGNTDFGLGDNPMPAPAQNTSAAQQPSPAASNDNVATQSTEETVAMPKKTDKTKPTEKPTTNPTETKQPEQPKEPEINKNALFPGSRNSSSNAGSNSNTGSSGNTYGSGNMGKPNGNPNSNNYAGNGGSGKGPSFSLMGRTASKMPEPKKMDNIFGQVVVNIQVDLEGNVKSASIAKGTTPALATNKALCDEIIRTAYNAKFNKIAKGQDPQIGTITYNFVL